MSKLKYVIVATLLAIPVGWALRAQTSKPATLTAADYLELQQLVARYSYAVDMHGGDGSAYAALFAPDGSLGTQAKGTAQLAEFAAQTNKDEETQDPGIDDYVPHNNLSKRRLNSYRSTLPIPGIALKNQAKR